MSGVYYTWGDSPLPTMSEEETIIQNTDNEIDNEFIKECDNIKNERDEYDGDEDCDEEKYFGRFHKSDSDEEVDMICMRIENVLRKYNVDKNRGNWLVAKNIVSDSHNNNCNVDKIWLCDILASDMKRHDQTLDDVDTVIVQDIKNGKSTRFTYEAGYFIENFKVPSYKPNGFLYTSNNNWDYKIVVLANKYMYISGGYIDQNSAFTG